MPLHKGWKNQKRSSSTSQLESLDADAEAPEKRLRVSPEGEETVALATDDKALIPTGLTATQPPLTAIKRVISNTTHFTSRITRLYIKLLTK